MKDAQNYKTMNQYLSQERKDLGINISRNKIGKGRIQTVERTRIAVNRSKILILTIFFNYIDIRVASGKARRQLTLLGSNDRHSETKSLAVIFKRSSQAILLLLCNIVEYGFIYCIAQVLYSCTLCQSTDAQIQGAIVALRTALLAERQSIGFF